MKKGKKQVLAGLLTVIAIQLVVLLLVYHGPGFAQEGEEADKLYASNPMVAATGACGIGDDVSVLYVIDTEKKQLAVYYSYGGRDIRFVAARKIFYDFELLYFNDATPRTHSVGKLKELYEKSKEGRTGSRSPRRRRR